MVSTLGPHLKLYTHSSSVPQSVTIAPLSDTLATTLAVVRDDIATHGKASKIMIFCPTARSTALSAEVFRQIKGLPPILEIHSRKTQANRSKAAEAFKDAKTSILFSSDVAARGMDFPGWVYYDKTPFFPLSLTFIVRQGYSGHSSRLTIIC